MTQHIMYGNELYLPAKSLKHIFFLRDELFVAIRDADVV